MENVTNEIEFLTFKSGSTSKGFRRSRTITFDKGGRIAVSMDIREEIAENPFMRVAQNRLTGDVFLVFEKTESIQSITINQNPGKSNKNTLVNNKDMSNTFIKMFGGNHARLTKNLSVLPECITYKIIKLSDQ